MTLTRFLELLNRAADRPSTYVRGGIGQHLNDTNKRQLSRRYPSNDQRPGFIAADRNVFAWDCCGLIKGILWGWTGSSASLGGVVYESNDVPDVSEEGLLRKLQNVSEDMTKVEAGEMVWLPGHCGVYVGDGTVIESTPAWQSKCQRTKFTDRPWQKHGLLPWVKYWKNISVYDFQIAAAADGFRFPKYGTDGIWGSETEKVAKEAICKKRLLPKYRALTRLIQKALNIPADGIFGTQTKKAVKEYQTEVGLEADGEVGIKTWRKLLNV